MIKIFTTENTENTEKKCLHFSLRLCGSILLVLLIFSGSVIFAQDSERFLVTVLVESAIIREHPADDALLAASAFEDQKLEAVGRNIDGTWLEVRRPGRLNNLGWIYNQIVEYDFRIERLPLTDSVTGLQGSIVPYETGFAAFINESVVLRTLPFYEGERITSLPYGVTVPVIERDSTTQWLKINYLGFEGWIIYFTVRPMVNVPDVPVSVLRSELEVPVVIIPPEV